MVRAALVGRAMSGLPRNPGCGNRPRTTTSAWSDLRLDAHLAPVRRVVGAPVGTQQRTERP